MNDHTRYHEAFGITAKDFKKLGVFNGFVDRDANFYIVPHMLQDSKIPEFENSYEKYKKHFATIVKFIKASKVEGDRFYRETVKKFIFHEIAHAGLGYSKSGKKGSGIGEKLAEQLTKGAIEIVSAGIEDPEIFELIGLLEEGIGADRISDMLLSILAEEFFMYTENMAVELKIPTKGYKYKGITYKIPHYKNELVVFVPEEFIVALPMAIDRDDISMVCAHNEGLRNRVNLIIAQGMEAGNKISKQQLKRLIVKEPALAKELVKLIKVKVNTSYDFTEDATGEFIWKDLAHDFSSSFPLSLDKKMSVKETVAIICNKYQELIENNGLFKFFHNSDGTHKNEKFAQMLFFTIAQSYCEANNLDLSPESDAGRGPVDFKISQSADTKVNVELKLSTNRLLHGYETQLPIYNKAEKTVDSFFLIILLYPKDMKKVKTVYRHKSRYETVEKKLPEIVVVDATWKESASKAKSLLG